MSRQREDSDARPSMRRAMSTLSGPMAYLGEYGEAPTIGVVMSVKRLPEKQTLVAELKKIATGRWLSVPASSGRFQEWIPLPDAKVESQIDYVELGSVAERDEYIMDQITRPSDPNQLQWQVTLVSYSNDPLAFDILWAISHALGDGMALASLLLSVAEPVKGNHKAIASVGRNTSDATPSLMNKLTQWLASGLILIGGIFKVLRIIFWWGDAASSLKAPSAAVLHRQEKLLRSRTFSLSRIKQAQIDGSTVNDVLVALVGGACDRILAERSDPVLQRSNPKMQAIVVMNHRGAPMKIEQGDAPLEGNVVTYVFVPIKLGGAQTPVSRLRGIREEIGRIKRSPEAAITALLNDLMFRTLPVSWFAAITQFLVAKGTVGVSTLRGPVKPVSFAGVEITNLFNCVNPISGVVVSCFTYYDQVTVSATSGKKYLADPSKFLDFVEDELAMLINSSEAKLDKKTQ